MSKPDQQYISHTPVYHSGGRAEMAQPIQQYGTQTPVYYAPSRNDVDERKFRVCCCCPVTCVIIVVIVLISLSVLCYPYYFISEDQFRTTTVFVLNSVCYAMSLTIGILLIAAMVVKKPILASAATILQLLDVTVSIVALVLYMLEVNERANEAASQIDNSGILGLILGSFVAICAVLGGFIGLVVGLWYTYAMYTYKRYLDYYQSIN